MLDKEQIDNWNPKLGSMDYARVVSAKKLKGSGLGMGDVVMVVAQQQVPASKRDPYLTRTIMTVVELVDDLPAIPKEGNDHKAYLVDPRSLEKLDDKQSKLLRDKLKAKYEGRSV